MEQGSYIIDPVTVGKFAQVSGVYVDQHGAWLGEVVQQDEQKQVVPYRDDNGNLVAAPDYWQCLIVRRLR